VKSGERLMLAVTREREREEGRRARHRLVLVVRRKGI